MKRERNDETYNLTDNKEVNEQDYAQLSLSKEQMKVYNSIIKEKNNVFITGPAGCGKSYLIEQISKELDSINIPVLVTSTTGIAALQLGGVTLHSALGLGILNKPLNQLKKIILNNPQRMNFWKSLKILIIDEISMLSAETFDKIDQCIRILRTNSSCFGGLQIILTGDFTQLPPIKNKNVKSNLIFYSNAWKNLYLRIHQLNNNKRQNDSNFFNMLQSIRFGNVTEYINKALNDRRVTKIPVFEDGINPTIIFGRNKSVDEYNFQKLSEINEKEYVFNSTWNLGLQCKQPYKNSKKTIIYSEASKDDYNWPVEEYQKMCKLNASQLEYNNNLKLKNKAQVILTYNLDVKFGLSNGIVGTVEAINDQSVLVNFGNKIGIHSISYIEKFLILKEIKNENTIHVFGAILKFLPLKLGWAITAHKSQGMTLDRVVAKLDKYEVFENGQAYTILSRVKDIDGLYLLSYDHNVIKCDPLVKDFYKNIKKYDNNNNFYKRAKLYEEKLEKLKFISFYSQ